MLATPAAAQQAGSGWTGQATVYGWLPAVNGAQEGPDGSPIIDLNKNDVLSRLDMAFMGVAEIRKDRFGLLLDVVYADLSNDGEWLQGRVQTSSALTLGMYTLAAAYRVHEADRSFADLYAGARFFDTDLSFGIATDRFGREADVSLDWADPIVGVRGAMPLSERWSVSGFADVGGFDAGSDLSWELYGGLNYAFTDDWAGVVGYRYMSILYEASDRAQLDIDIQGPVLGVTYRF
jgi:opacity protein-like surface antigen